MVALARGLGLLREEEVTWAELRALKAESYNFGSEHAVDFSDESPWVVKITIPHHQEAVGNGISAFGFTPCLTTQSFEDFRGGPPTVKQHIEFIPATPLEYLERWIAANDIFGDRVELRAVILWKCQHVSFVISQPLYNGEPARDAQIIEYFKAEGWTKIADPTREHLIFYNYAFDILAMDAASRNCYHSEGYLLPFDVILSKPDAELAAFLQLYPD